MNKPIYNKGEKVCVDGIDGTVINLEKAIRRWFVHVELKNGKRIRIEESKVGCRTFKLNFEGYKL